jgi:hypothetical protein
MAKIKGRDFGFDRKEIAARRKALADQPRPPVDVSDFPHEIFQSGPPAALPERWIDPYPSDAVKPPTDLPHGAARRQLKRKH